MVTLLSFCFSFFFFSFVCSLLFHFCSFFSHSSFPLFFYFHSSFPLSFIFLISFSLFSSFSIPLPFIFAFLSLFFLHSSSFATLFFPFFLSPPSFSVSSLETFCSFLDYQTSEKYLMTPRSSTHTKLIKTLLLKHKRRCRNIFESIFPGELKVKSLIFQLFSFVPFSSPSRVI